MPGSIGAGKTRCDEKESADRRRAEQQEVKEETDHCQSAGAGRVSIQWQIIWIFVSRIITVLFKFKKKKKSSHCGPDLFFMISVMG